MKLFVLVFCNEYWIVRRQFVVLLPDSQEISELVLMERKLLIYRLNADNGHMKLNGNDFPFRAVIHNAWLQPSWKWLPNATGKAYPEVLYNFLWEGAKRIVLKMGPKQIDESTGPLKPSRWLGDRYKLKTLTETWPTSKIEWNYKDMKRVERKFVSNIWE